MPLANAKFIDLTHTLSSEIPHWSGQCGFQLNVEVDYKDCPTETKFKAQNANLFVGIGTHMDAPAHCFQNGLTIADIPLQQLITPCYVIDVSREANENYRVPPKVITHFENEHGPIGKNSFVLFYTGWDRYWNQPGKYRNELCFPSVAKETGALLFERAVVGLGIDTLSPDLPQSGYPIHQLFLGSGKYLVENVANAKQMPPVGAYTIALPIKIKDGTEAPIRLVGVISS